MTIKICSKCKTKKTLDNFYKNQKNGLPVAWCKSCYKTSKRKIIKCESCLKLASFHGKNLCKNCYEKFWRKQNPEKTKIRWRNNRIKYKKYYCDYKKKYQKTNRELFKIYRHKSECKKLGIIGSFNLKEWKKIKENHNFCCARCGEKEPFLNQFYPLLTIDHIIPINKGGNNFISNIQPLCLRCNSIKGHKPPFACSQWRQVELLGEVTRGL